MSIVLSVDTDADMIGSTLADYPEEAAATLDAIVAAMPGATELATYAADVARHLNQDGAALIRAIAAKLGASA